MSNQTQTLAEQIENLKSFTPSPTGDQVVITSEVAMAAMGTAKLMTEAVQNDLFRFVGVKAYASDNGGDVYYLYFMNYKRKRFSISLKDFVNRCTINGKASIEATPVSDDGNLLIPEYLKVAQVNASAETVYPLGSYIGYTQTAWQAHRSARPNEDYATQKASYIAGKTLRPNANPFLEGIDFIVFNN